jgi:hypothetical protein
MLRLHFQQRLVSSSMLLLMVNRFNMPKVYELGIKYNPAQALPLAVILVDHRVFRQDKTTPLVQVAWEVEVWGENAWQCVSSFGRSRRY